MQIDSPVDKQKGAWKCRQHSRPDGTIVTPKLGLAAIAAFAIALFGGVLLSRDWTVGAGTDVFTKSQVDAALAQVRPGEREPLDDVNAALIQVRAGEREPLAGVTPRGTSPSGIAPKPGRGGRIAQ